VDPDVRTLVARAALAEVDLEFNAERRDRRGRDGE